MSDSESAMIEPAHGPCGPELRVTAAPAETTRSWADFERVVIAEQARVARLASRLLGWRSDVDDVVQDVFLQAWRGWARFREESSVSTWLTRITINACRAKIRSWGVWLRLIARRAEQGLREEAAVDGGDSRLALDDCRRVHAAVRALPQKLREVVVLHYLEEMPTAEVATALGLSVGAIEVRLHRGRARLRESLGRLWEEWS